MQRAQRLVGHLTSPVERKADLSASAVAGVAKYTYTAELKDSALTKEQRDFYEKNGFLVIKKCVPLDAIEQYRQRFVDISTGKVERHPFMTMMRDVAIAKKKEMGENAITKLQDFAEDEVLFGYCKHPNVLKYVRSFIGPDIHAMHTMLINKPTDVGLGSSRHPPHQDLWYFPFRPPHKIVCAWTAMQKIDTENGCLFVQPGSHKGELLKHTYPNDGIVNKAYHGIHNLTEEDGKKMFHVIMEAGDTVFFHPLLIHGSGRNNSDRFRKAISCHYAAADCTYEEVVGTIQEEIAKEIEDMAKAKLGAALTFEDIWRFRGRHVAGKPGNISLATSPTA